MVPENKAPIRKPQQEPQQGGKRQGSRQMQKCDADPLPGAPFPQKAKKDGKDLTDTRKDQIVSP